MFERRSEAMGVLSPVRDIETSLSSIRRILYKYADDGLVRCEGGATFIRPLGKGSLSFLHKLYAGCSDAEIRAITTIIGFNPPDDYIAFMKLTDGAALFDNTLSVYGLKSNAARSVQLQDQAAISLKNKVGLQRSMGNYEWIPVGSVSAATVVFSLEMDCNCRVRFGSEERGFRQFLNFLEAVEFLMAVEDNLSNKNGLIDESGVELERDLLALVSRT
jgi:hypothetical protein